MASPPHAFSVDETIIDSIPHCDISREGPSRVRFSVSLIYLSFHVWHSAGTTSVVTRLFIQVCGRVGEIQHRGLIRQLHALRTLSWFTTKEDSIITLTSLSRSPRKLRPSPRGGLDFLARASHKRDEREFGGPPLPAAHFSCLLTALNCSLFVCKPSIRLCFPGDDGCSGYRIVRMSPSHRNSGGVRFSRRILDQLFEWKMLARLGLGRKRICADFDNINSASFLCVGRGRGGGVCNAATFVRKC